LNNQCNSCPSNSVSHRTLVNHTCVCDIGFYDDGTSENCQPCHKSCESCAGPLKSDCTSCKTSNQRYLSTTECICNDGFFENNQATCGDCHYSCKTCNGANSNNCLSCENVLN